MLVRWSAVAALWLALLAPAVSLAQSGEGGDADFQTVLDQALADYQARRYVEAAEGFQRAFDLRPEPELMYNRARSLERALRREEAIAAYDQFLALPGTTSETRSRALTARTSLQQELAAMSTPPPETEPQEAADPTPPPASSASRGGEPTSEEAAGGALEPVGWVLVGLGAAGVAVGAVFGGLALAANDDFNATTDRAEQMRLQSEVRRYALLTDVLIGVGAGVAIAGVIFVIVDLASGGGERRDQASLELVPVAGPDALGLAAAGRF